MEFAGDLSKSSKWELLHLKEVSYWHRAGSGIQEVFNRMKAANTDTLDKMDTGTIEVWTTTLLALALQHKEEKIFWLGKPRNDPPDMAVMTIADTGHFLARELEVTRCRHPDEELVKNILKKDEENNFSEKYIVCGFVEVSGTYDFIKMGTDLQASLKRIKNVVLIIHGVGVNSRDEEVNFEAVKNLWTVVQIAPVFDSVTLDISAEYRNWMADTAKLVYTKNAGIWYGKRNPTEPYPTLLPDTPLT